MPRSEDAPTFAPRPSAQFATVKDAQEATKLSRHTILRLIERGDLEARKVGRQIRIPWSALEKIGTPLGGAR